MKVVNQKQLTLNTFSNALALSNTKFDDWFNAAISSAEPHFNQFLMFLKQEFEDKRLTKNEMIHLLDLYFYQPDSIIRREVDKYRCE